MDTSKMDAAKTAYENKPLASLLHTIILIFILIALSILGASLHNNSGAVSPKIPMYVSLLIGEWALLFYVWRGLKKRGISITSIIFRSTDHKIFLKDIYIALVFWIVANIILTIIQLLLGMPLISEDVKFLLPQSILEIIIFIFVAVSAGFCEEIVYRGYLQKQFQVLSKNKWAGIIIQAFIFGISHGYQGYKNMLVIFIYGILFGILAYFAGSLKPGIISHAWEDIFSGIIFPVLMK